MRPQRADRRVSPWVVPALGLWLAVGLIAPLSAQSTSDLAPTRHNLSVSGPGPVRALTEDRICVFCHTPHNATPQSPLWNRELEPQVYNVYASPTLVAGPLGQPTGPTKLCLSCHDGTVAMGAVVVPAGGIAMAGGGALPPGSLADFGLDLSGHHPVSFPYSTSLPNPELASSPPADLVYGGLDEVHCITCHDPHNDQYGDFLVRDNRYSALCITCHQIPGWIGSQHQTSAESTVGVLPRPPRTVSTWTTLAEWGCETCHTPHFAATPPQLLNFTEGPPEPFSCTSAGCHSSQPGPPHVAGAPGGVRSHLLAVGSGQERADIAGQVKKVSAHHETPGVYSTSNRGPGGAGRSGIRGVGCADCHNPHAAADTQAEAPLASGLLRDVSGVNRYGVEVARVTYEYEVCFKCHADNSGDFERVPRVIGGVNTRLDFDPSNVSAHPVVAAGRSGDVPSLSASLDPEVSANGVLYCTSCHADDGGVSKGPHGSDFAPILRERYELADGTPESYESYALCYRCHERTSILGDQSFRTRAARATASGGGHSGHLQNGAACATCHDPHGIPDRGVPGAGQEGSHTHLVNFDLRAVQPLPGNPVPLFEDTGLSTGNCTLVCHGVVHDHLAYP